MSIVIKKTSTETLCPFCGIDCGTVERKHCANGRCRPCDDRWRHSRTTG